MLGVMCLVALLQLVGLFLLVLSLLVFFAYGLCVLMCAVQAPDDGYINVRNMSSIEEVK